MGKKDHNVSCIKSALVQSHILDTNSEHRGVHTIGGVCATSEQEHNLLSFRDIGEESAKAYVEYFIIGSCSAKVPVGLKRLQTFSSKKKVEKKTKLREKVVSKCISRQLAWSSHTQSAQKCRGEQYLELPRALCSHDGVPHKGQ